MKVFIRNESDATLTFSSDEIVHGDYTPDWTPPSVIQPGERKGFQGEGNIVHSMSRLRVQKVESVTTSLLPIAANFIFIGTAH
ncbi:hypothetical protein C7B65_05550 [Phormidesmis priestleyi ULC007]|uniref:Uncharacterized protein n=1 Tax=Phormidesmis priestleyi ULC007 TaxID=1920490 RepID=A0A2T1DK90_9CYAN|nr:hypothetical protein C7B65_05550 [Phormidesmis priestleyi ULC007]PZO51830.1 MAG: hypothetical protein DCF14_07695 [Phormidesmis priestleyi]